MYQKWLKRLLDILLSAMALITLSPIIGVIALLVKYKLGSPVIFKQIRPGKKGTDGKEKLFILYKFRSMTDAKDNAGKEYPDELRLTKFGKLLRKTSLDELPELWNILKGDMSIIGPRPLLVRDMVFMTKEQRERHNVRPGLSGLAQINGRNCIKWDDKLKFDLEYLKRISFHEDMRIVLITVIKVFRTESISYEGMATAEDLGDYLLKTKTISITEYEVRQSEVARYMMFL